MHSIGPQRLHNNIFFQVLLETFSNLRSIVIVIAYEKFGSKQGVLWLGISKSVQNSGETKGKFPRWHHLS